MWYLEDGSTLVLETLETRSSAKCNGGRDTDALIELVPVTLVRAQVWCLHAGLQHLGCTHGIIGVTAWHCNARDYNISGRSDRRALPMPANDTMPLLCVRVCTKKFSTMPCSVAPCSSRYTLDRTKRNSPRPRL